MDSVMSLVGENPAVIFSKSSCCMCHTIVQLIRGFGANLTVYELDQLPKGKQIERELLALGRNPSVPAVFVGQKLIGGANEVMALHVQNELGPMLIKAGAIFFWKRE
ncbi:monothiol glutaredoxin-S6 [Cornus florida]|uniref:monothiol glutaredoxin-S6 n=1 Tax=Cornus florida TaxID=4283 RepID=UPI002896B4E5|nr:monothiol glutaredoxin-S6 [Cornus florida]